MNTSTLSTLLLAALLTACASNKTAGISGAESGASGSTSAAAVPTTEAKAAAPAPAPAQAEAATTAAAATNAAAAEAAKAKEAAAAKAKEAMTATEVQRLYEAEKVAASQNLRAIRFAYDSAEVPTAEEALLMRHANRLLRSGKPSANLEGHADERGSREYNFALGLRRAEAVRKGLVALGVEDSRLSTSSAGEEKPAANEQTEEAYAQNRRVEVVHN